MPIKDLKDEFVEAGQGQLHLVGCKMPYVEGPDGKRHWQQLIFWGGHGPSNRQFVVNPLAGLDTHLLEGRVVVTTPPVAPMGDLVGAAQAAARAVLAALASKQPT